MPANRIKKEPAYERRALRQAQKKTKSTSCRILIVCEGEKTEPEYFKKFKTINPNNFVYEIKAEGYGYSNLKLVEKAKELLNANISVPYDAVWVVFDKDEFPDDQFDNAIRKASASGINVAWTNEAFELWYLLHFQYRNTGMKRWDYENAISTAVNQSPIYDKNVRYRYDKGSPDNYDIMMKHGNLEDAIKNAEKLINKYSDQAYHSHNPCTTVHYLVRQLLNRDDLLIKAVMKKINSKAK